MNIIFQTEIQRLRTDGNVLSKHTQSMEEMKKEILLQQRDLLRERTKVKALKTELENPLNVHRSNKVSYPILKSIMFIHARK